MEKPIVVSFHRSWSFSHHITFILLSSRCLKMAENLIAEEAADSKVTLSLAIAGINDLQS